MRPEAQQVRSENAWYKEAFADLHFSHARNVFPSAALIVGIFVFRTILGGNFDFQPDAILDLCVFLYSFICSVGMRRGFVNRDNIHAATFVLALLFLGDLFSLVFTQQDLLQLMGTSLLLVAFGFLALEIWSYALLAIVGLLGSLVAFALVPDTKGIGSTVGFLIVTAQILGALCFTERRNGYRRVLGLQLENETRARELESSNARYAEAAEKAKIAAQVASYAATVAERANEAKRVFLANMSHELRTPMTGVLGMIDVLSHTRLDTEQRECVETARTTANLLLDILNDILDYSKLEAGKLVLKEEPLDPLALTRDVAALLEFTADSKKILLETTAAPGIPAAVLGDPTRLRQILFNLAGNAVKFTDKGHVRIHLEWIAETPRDGSLCWTVADTGIGISHETLQSLFTRFEQADPSDTRRFGGTGLGLAICKELTSLMGGSIGAESSPGVGSRFSVSIPVKLTEVAVAVEAVADVRTSLQGLRILVAEDNIVNQKLISKLLGREGAIVQLADNGFEAVRAVESGDYDVVLMDIQMPELNGIQATQKIRSRPRLAALPIIALTANAFDSDRDEYFAAGMNGFVAKPIVIDALLAEIGRCLKRGPLEAA